MWEYRDIYIINELYSEYTLSIPYLALVVGVFSLFGSGWLFSKLRALSVRYYITAPTI